MPDVTPLTPSNVGSGTNVTPDTIAGDFNLNDFMALEMQQAGIYQQGLQLQANDIQKHNEFLSELQGALSEIDPQVPSDPSNDNGGNATIPTDVARLMYEDDSARKYLQGGFLPNNGTTPISWGKGGATALASWLKDKISQNSNDSQMNMLTLQGQMNNYNSQFQMMSQMLSERNQTRGQIIGNIR